MNLPKIHLKKSHQERILAGHPWIFSNEIENFSVAKNLPKGSLVQVNLHDNKPFALAYFNAHSLISCRILSYDISQKIDENFFVEKLNLAKILREKFFNQPFYRLIHSEGDNLPGLVIDRFDNIFICQISTAGMENLREFLINALHKIFNNCEVIFKNNSESRKLEALEIDPENSNEEASRKILIKENEIDFLIDLKNSQKTGWFFDQRINREFISSIAKNQDVFDGFCYVGGFGINAIKAGARSVVFADSSQEAISLTKENCQNFLQQNKLETKTEFFTSKIFDLLENSEFQNRRFDIVLLDPPAFIKNKKDLFAGLRGYEKLIKLAAYLVKKNGVLMLSSCSHNANIQDLILATNNGFRKANRSAKLIRNYGAGFDHPINPALKENEYLKSLTFLIE